MSPIPDERLRLIFTTCHPALAPEARVGLTLRALGGLTTAEVARAFLISERAMAQRITRAKAKIAGAGIRYEVPRDADLPDRLRSVLATVYLVFNAGYGPPVRAGAVRRGDPARARAGAADARRGRGDRAAGADAAAGLAPRRARGRGRQARPAPGPGPLAVGHRSRSPRANGWSRAAGGWAVSAPTSCRRRSPSSIRAARTGRRSSGSTTSSTRSPRPRSWRSTARWRSPSATAPRPAWPRWTASTSAGYHLFHAARADLLRRLDRRAEAADAYRAALALTDSPVEREFLEARLRSTA